MIYPLISMKIYVEQNSCIYLWMSKRFWTDVLSCFVVTCGHVQLSHIKTFFFHVNLIFVEFVGIVLLLLLKMKQNPFDFATAYDLFCQKSVKRFSVDMGKVQFCFFFKLFILLCIIWISCFMFVSFFELRESVIF